MGHFSHNCKLTGVPITGGQPVVLFVLKPRKDLYDLSEKKLNQYGKTYMCSNEGTRLKFYPVWFPIKGEYDDYGGIENIVKDDNTKILEDYYGLTIEQIMGIVTCGRKDDGYSDDLKVIKKPFVYPEDWIKGEKHRQYYSRTQNDPEPFDGHYPTNYGDKYQVWRDGKMVKATKEEYEADNSLSHAHYMRYDEWAKTNPDPDRDYGNPQYEDRYKELLTYSGMWIHGKVYDELTKIKNTDVWKDSLDLGTPALLKSLGFTQGEETKSERYNIPFTKDGLTVYSDGTWLEIPGEHIYRLKDFKKYCKKKGVEIDITDLDSKDMIEQTYDYVIPEYKLPRTREEILADFERIKETTDKNIEELKEDLFDALLSIRISTGYAHDGYRIPHYFLNDATYGTNEIKNPFTSLYIKAAKEGKVRNNLVEYWRFDSYMYACGVYYEIVGTGPQDGELKQVKQVLTVALNVVNERLKERDEDWEDEEDEEED